MSSRSFGAWIASAVVQLLWLSPSPARAETWLYPMNHAPHAEPMDDITARERRFEEAWKSYFQKLDEMVKAPDRKELDAFIKSKSGRDLLLLATDYGYGGLKEPALAKLAVDFNKRIELAAKVLSKAGITDIGDVEDLNVALDAAVLLKSCGRFTPEMSAKVEDLVTRYVEDKAVFWGFTKKFPYYMSGYNKEAITMDVASSVKLLYQGTGKFPVTIDSFDAAFAQVLYHGYELDNSPHYDASVNLNIILDWAVRHGRIEDLRKAPHFRMIFQRMARMVMANGENANYGKSMSAMRKKTVEGREVDDYRVLGSMGVGTCLRWAYRFYGDPDFLYLARKYEAMNGDGKIPLTIMPKALDLNFFNVRGVALRADSPLCFSTIRLKGPGWSLDRGVRREKIEPVPDKLVLSTGSHPRSPSMLMDLSFTQSKVKDQRRMGIDNHLFNGAHTVTIVGRPDAAEETNRIFLLPDDVTYPGTGEWSAQKSKRQDRQTYQIADYHAGRINADLAYGVVEYSQFQYPGVHSRRRMALLNNGVMAVLDEVWTDANYKGGLNAGTVYNVWSKVVAKGDNWVLTNPRQPHFPEASKEPCSSALLYLAPAEGLKIATNQDIDFFASRPLVAGTRLRIVSAIIPVNSALGDPTIKSLADGIRSSIDGTGLTTLSIPYGPGQTLKVAFTPDDSAAWQLEGAKVEMASVPKLNAVVNPPYSVAFNRTSEFYVPDFKADFDLRENRFKSVLCGGRELVRGRDFQTVGSVLSLTPAFADSLIKARSRTDLTVKFDKGADVVMKLNADTDPGITLFNSKRSKTYVTDEMAMAYGFRDNDRVKATAADFEIRFYTDWLYRGEATVVKVKAGETVKLPTMSFRSFQLKQLN